MSLVISKVFTYDEDAGNYIQAVEAADEAASPGIGALEPATRQAINNFVVGCKQDGIWSAIKASCILAGARTTNGALIPLKGTAPTPVNFDLVNNTDYNRKTGLVGNGSTKYLDSNRLNTADPLSNLHISTFVASNNTSTDGGNYGMLGTNHSTAGVVSHQFFQGKNYFRAGNNSLLNAGGNPSFGNYLMGISRNSSSSFQVRTSKSNFTEFSQASAYFENVNYCIFRGSAENGRNWFSNARLAFYSIGEALDLQKLDSRVTDLITAFGAAIP